MKKNIKKPVLETLRLGFKGNGSEESSGQLLSGCKVQMSTQLEVKTRECMGKQNVVGEASHHSRRVGKVFLTKEIQY